MRPRRRSCSSDAWPTETGPEPRLVLAVLVFLLSPSWVPTGLNLAARPELRNAEMISVRRLLVRFRLFWATEATMCARSLGGLWMALLVGSGCGGDVVGSGSEVDSPANAAADETDGTSSDYVQLGPCQKGFDPRVEVNRDCDWLADNLCYATKEAACACICPTDHPATCISGFFNGTGGKTKVSCI